MEQLESVGWVKATKKESNEITELDINEIFTMIDVDKSGSVSRRVNSKISCIILIYCILSITGGKNGLQAAC